MISDSFKKRQQIQETRERFSEGYINAELEKNTKWNVYLVPISLLTLNPRNSRFQSKITAWSENNFLNYYKPEGQKIISEWIFDSNKTYNIKTMRDIKEKGQQIPAIITSDGLIVDGNRRFILLKKIFDQELNNKKFSKLKVIILNNKFASNTQEIKRIELKLQYGKNAPLDYDRINTMLAVRDVQTSENWDNKKTADYFDLKTNEIKSFKLTLKYITDYLSFIGWSGKYNLVSNAEDQFKNLATSHVNIDEKIKKTPINWKPNTEDFENYKNTMFKVLRTKPSQHAIRPLVNGGSVFLKKEIWENFNQKTENIYSKGLRDSQSYFKNNDLVLESKNLKKFEDCFLKKTKKHMSDLIFQTTADLKPHEKPNSVKVLLEEIESKTTQMHDKIFDLIETNSLTKSWKKQIRKIKKIRNVLFKISEAIEERE